MRVIPVVLTLALALAVSTGPASARFVGIEEVRLIAFDHGIVRIKEIEYHKRRGIWEVEGKDAYGHEIEMKVDAYTGRIVKLERD